MNSVCDIHYPKFPATELWQVLPRHGQCLTVSWWFRFAVGANMKAWGTEHSLTLSRLKRWYEIHGQACHVGYMQCKERRCTCENLPKWTRCQQQLPCSVEHIFIAGAHCSPSIVQLYVNDDTLTEKTYLFNITSSLPIGTLWFEPYSKLMLLSRFSKIAQEKKSSKRKKWKCYMFLHDSVPDDNVFIENAVVRHAVVGIV